MKIYQINKETNEVIKEYSNVIRWGYNFIEYNDDGRCKIYCGENEYFTDKRVGEKTEIN